MRRIEDARLAKASLDDALEIGREYGDHECNKSGGEPGGIVCTPLRGGAYRVRVSWTTSGAGGRSGRKRHQPHALELIPPQAASHE